MASTGSARPLRWLIVGPFSAVPNGHITPVSGERFSTVIAKVGPRVGLDVPDHIGGGASRHLELEFSRLRSFRASDIVAQDDTLRQLAELADRLSKDRGAGDPAAAVERIAGPGALARAIRGEPAAPEPEPESEPAPAASSQAPAPAPEASDAPSGDGVDAIFSKAAVAPQSTSHEAKSALSSFIGAMRSTGGPASTSPSQREQSDDAASIIRATIASTVQQALAHSLLTQLEIAWRGLSMVVSAAPGADDMAVDLLNADPAATADAIAHALDRPGLDRADAVFITGSIGDTAQLTRLAALAAERRVPIVVEIPSALAGVDPTDGEDPSEAWTELRADDNSRWLAVVANAPALYEEPAPYTRLRFGGAALAVAAMTAASVGRTALPGDVLGRSGTLTGPAAHDVEIRSQQLTIPTEDFCSVIDQNAAAERGVILLGSEPGRPALRLAACPTLASGPDATSLPGQILAGRVTRLATQVREEHPTATGDELQAALAEASGRLLPNADTSAVALTVRTDSDSDAVTVDGSIGANLAGATFKFSSDV